jgi:hypothetical protein
MYVPKCKSLMTATICTKVNGPNVRKFRVCHMYYVTSLPYRKCTVLLINFTEDFVNPLGMLNSCYVTLNIDLFRLTLFTLPVFAASFFICCFVQQLLSIN